MAAGSTRNGKFTERFEIMFTKLVRLGRDPKASTTPTGTQLTQVTAAYNVGWGDNKKTVWCDLVAFGKTGERLASHCQKGKQLVVTIDDVAPAHYKKQDGTVADTLKGKIIDFDFVSGEQQQQQGRPMAPQPNQQMAQPQPAQFAQQPAQNFQNFGDEEIPF